MQRLQTVIETPEFAKQTKHINRETIEQFITFIALSPLAGTIMQSAEGVRKIRWYSNTHQGKRGGLRILYYYHDRSIPIFLLTAYTKNQQVNIGNKDKIVLSKLIR